MTHSEKNNMENKKRALTETELEKICILYHKMSLSAKHAFLATVMMKNPHNYIQVVDSLGELYEKTIVRA